tara:strand:+ start:3284 stop:3451 length:168 start_codon:yes stop_codon:yes gene_type:complete
LRGIAIDIATPGDFEILKPSFGKLARKLCFQQSAGDSTSPEVDVPLGTFQNGLVH